MVYDMGASIINSNVNNDNKNLEKELARKKSEIIKMSNDEIVKYWQDEFKK